MQLHHMFAAPPCSHWKKRSPPRKPLYLAVLPPVTLCHLSNMHSDLVTDEPTEPRPGFLVSASVDGHWAHCWYDGGAGRSAVGRLVDSRWGGGKGEEPSAEIAVARVPILQNPVMVATKMCGRNGS